jgi:hypothetical protein
VIGPGWRRRIPALLVFAIVLALSACGDDDGIVSGVGDDVPSPVESESQDPTSPVEDPTDELPPIVVDSPQPGSEIRSPVTISGTANVFEATVSIRIINSSGDVIQESFTTATCGTGCRGDYTAEVEFEVDKVESGIIEVYEQSMEDGSDLHKVSFPVILVPASS